MSTTILGIELATDSKAKLREQLHEWLTEQTPRQIVTVNPEILVATTRSAQSKTALQNADLRLTDGAGILFVSKLLRLPVPERFTGVELVDELCTLAAKVGRSVYLVGGGQGVAKKAAIELQKRHPDLRVSGAEEGIPKLTDARFQALDPAMEEVALVQRIHQAKPSVVFVAFGHPKQEEFIAMHKQELGASVLVGVGGTFDFLAGTVQRAPKLLQTLWLEWLWRLIVQPWRIKRIWDATVVFPYLAIRDHFQKHKPESVVNSRDAKD